MSDRPVSVIVSVYNALRELELALAGFSRQSYQNFELLVADDGSRHEVGEFVERFSRTATFPIRFLTQADEGFRKCRILNKAIAAAQGEYIIFSDGDCIPHSGFVKAHIDNRRTSKVLCGRRVNLSERFSTSLRVQDVLAGRLERGGALGLAWDQWRGRLTHWEEGIILNNSWLRESLRKREPVLFGCNFSVEKSILERVNGFNEDFREYWGEDVELQHRMKLGGADIRWLRNI